MKNDAYDQEITYLTEHPERIYYHWNMGSPLFQKACNYKTCEPTAYGCLTQIRSDPAYYKARTPELTAAILADDRIPVWGIINVEHLSVFAEWQRRLNRELNRKPSVFDLENWNSNYARDSF